MGDEDLDSFGNPIWEKTRGSHRLQHYADLVTALATYSPAGSGLTTVDPRMQLGRSEPLGLGVKRVTMAQLELAASGFFEGEAVFPNAIHESRKAVKRVRAMLRLVRSELSDKIFRYENQSLAETARMVGEIRAAAAVTEVAELIRDIYGELLATGTFEELIARLAHRRDVMEMAALEDPNLVGRVVRSLERAHGRYSSWPTDPEARRVYGIGIRDDYRAIEPGLGSSYRAGRHRMVSAYKSRKADDFHSWRKRAKDLKHQMEFLVPLWPEVVSAWAITLGRLSEILGEDHDLAELLDLVRERPDLCPNPRERSLFHALVQQRRHELQLAAEILGRRVYAEKPTSVSGRFADYWDSRQLAIAETPEAFVVY